MRLDVLGLARALGAVEEQGSAGGRAASSNADDDDADAAFASAWLQSSAVLALHPSR